MGFEVGPAVFNQVATPMGALGNLWWTFDFVTENEFICEIDDVDLGSWNSVDGISMNMETKTVKEGGNNAYAYHLPTRMNYGTLKLSRPLTFATRNSVKWFQKNLGSGKKFTGSVRVYRPIPVLEFIEYSILSWDFKGLVPKSWQGPSFGAEKGAVAKETVELTYESFSIGDIGGRIDINPFS